VKFALFLSQNQTTSPHAHRATLMFCDKVMPAKMAGSSPRSISSGQRVIGYATMSTAIVSPAARTRREYASNNASRANPAIDA
jgi:hypothetical protein